MKAPLMIMASFIALTGMIAGCNPSATISPVAEETDVRGPEFSANSGLFLPDETRRSLGLKIADVTEQKISSTIPLSLRVYGISTNSILATIAITSEQAQLLNVGQPISAEVNAGKIATGKIQRVSDELRRATGLMELLVEIVNAPDGVAVGDFISATARLESKTSVVTIPRRALLENSEGQFAYTVSGEHFVRTAIKTGTGNDEFVEITDGLYAGDQVVVQPVLSLWLTELAAVKGGQACCVTPPKGK